MQCLCLGKFDSWLHQYQDPATISTPHTLSPGHRGNTGAEEIQKQLETLRQTIQSKDTLIEQLEVSIRVYVLKYQLSRDSMHL